MYQSGSLSNRGPMGPQSGSLSDRGPMGPQSGPLSMRGPQPTGRGMTPERRMKIAERQAVSRGDAAGAAQWASRAQWAGQFSPQQGMPMMPQQAPQPMPMAPVQPTGRLVPGRSAGSMVWQPDEVPVVDVPESPMPPPLEVRGQRSEGRSEPVQEPLMPMMPQSGPLDNDRNILGPLTGPRPDMEVIQVPGMDYGMPFYKGVPSKQYLPMKPPDAPLSWNPVPGTNGLMMPSGKGSDRLPVMQQQTMNPGWSITGQPEKTQMVPLEKPVAVKAPTLKQIYENDVPQNVQWNEQRKRWERVKIYDPGDPDDNGVPGDQRSGAATTTTTASQPAMKTTSSGISYGRID